MKKWKKTIAYVLIGVVLFSIVQLGGVERVEASQKSAAIKAYKEFLTTNSWQDGEAYFSGKYFGLKDLNGDKVPELIINSGENKTRKRAYTIVTYDSKYKEAYVIYSSWINDDCYYNASKKCIVDKGIGGISETAFKITKKGEIKWLADISYDENGKPWTSTVEGKKTSYKKAKAKMDSYLKGAKLIKTPYKITKNNIKKYVK